MISHSHKTVFVHIPKNAGQSVERVFLKLHGLEWKRRQPLLLGHNDDPAKGPPRLAHLTAMEYVRCGHMSAEQYAEYYSFSFVRNPWTRMVSFYKYLGEEEKQDFKSFVASTGRRLAHSNPWFLRPQADYLFDDNGELQVKQVGRFESLQADFDTVCRGIGLEPIALPHVNKSDKKPAARSSPDYYDDEAVQMVGEIYQRDVAAFGYQYRRG